MAAGLPLPQPSAAGPPVIVQPDTAVESRRGRHGAAVVAAGALCWRKRAGTLEVLLIHRPRYDDWSWPKGKIDAGETTPECAVREVREEIGITVKLGVPLPTIEYQVSSGLKVVHYWAAKAEGMTPTPDGKEVDDFLWCSAERAAELLSNPSDREPLDALVEACAEDNLDTWPLIVVRHAKAKPRSSWTRAEGERPLAASGRRQALAVSRLLQAWSPDRIVSSPWDRCVQTIMPYVKRSNAKLKLVDALTERDAARKPGRASSTVDKLFDRRVPVAVCSHRPVLPLILDVLRAHMPPHLGKMLPVSDPYLAPGEAIICQVSTRKSGQVVSVEQFRAYDD